ncbi:MAG: hypothetical protein KME57_10400 [Scytonema hyalinum WJT4-NPBG1]|jgi:hypothetical protein|nr:hypothetical protein [Scytonema hyalinum WJT4-NPBG1]
MTPEKSLLCSVPEMNEPPIVFEKVLQLNTVLELLNEAGFHQVRRFFTSLSFSAWVAQKGG